MGCKQCNKKVCDSDRIVCRGFCGSAFHMICVKVDVPALDVMGMHPNNFFWMCDECSKLFLSSHFRNLVKDSDAGPKAFVESMKSVQSDIAKLASTVAALNEKVEAQSTSSSDWPTLGQKRQRDSSADPPEDICTMVKECLSVDADDPVVVKMLVKKGADITKLSSVTFKVGVGRDYRESSLDADNWPEGLAFREFIDFSNRPSVTAGFSKRRTE
ncbi:hypothetical protein pipiens_009478 [Culex pipiens pipiens]|uniref:PHD-type domain-containing protein n=1 Tax=Culex pipiens pipiens TaxID=38569 RepID=A0ABD1DE19_CULPP